jgi:hypothetical protein
MDAIRMRDLVLANLAELGYGRANWLGERLLFRDRFYVGICLSFEGVSATWMVDTGEVKFIDESGRLMKVVTVPASQGLTRQAA